MRILGVLESISTSVNMIVFCNRQMSFQKWQNFELNYFFLSVYILHQKLYMYDYFTFLININNVELHESKH